MKPNSIRTLVLGATFIILAVAATLFLSREDRGQVQASRPLSSSSPQRDVSRGGEESRETGSGETASPTHDSASAAGKRDLLATESPSSPTSNEYTSSTTVALEDAFSSDSLSSGSTALNLRFLWARTRDPVPGLQVELHRGHSGEGEALAGTTDATGCVRILHPRDWTEGRVLGRRPSAFAGPRDLRLPQTVEIAMGVEHTYAAYGRVYVRDKEGAIRPVEGAQVTAKSRFPERALTQADGSWRLDGLSEKSTVFFASNGELSASLGGRDGRQVLLQPGIDNGPFDLYLDKTGLAVTGAVLRAQDLSPIPGAVVRAEKLAVETDTDEKGCFILDGLAPGEIELTASADDYADAIFAVKLEEGKDATAIIHMKPGGTIRVLAVDQVGTPVPSATVHCSSSAGHGLPLTDTNAEGRLDLARLDATLSYRVSVWCRQVWSDDKNVSFAPGQTEAEVTLTLPFNLAENIANGTKAVFEGRVTSEGGWPIAGATVMFRQYWDLHVRLPDVKKKTQTGADGRYRVEFVKAAPWQCQASVCAEGWGTQWKDVQADGTSEKAVIVDFELHPERTIRGVVVDSKGNPLSGVAVEAWPAAGYDIFFPGQPETLSAADGAFWVRGLEGDSVRMVLKKEGWQPILGQVVRTDEKEIRFIMKSGAAIRGRVVDAKTEEPIPNFSVLVGGPGIDDEQSRVPRKFYAEDGRFSIHGLGEGNAYRVRIEAMPYLALDKNDVKATASDSTGETVFTLERQGNATGVVLDAATGRPVAGATVVAEVTGQSPSIYAVVNGGAYAGGSFRAPTIVQTDSLGQFSVPSLDQGMSFLFLADGYAPFGVPAPSRSKYVDPASGDLKVSLSRGAHVTVVVSSGGKPLADQNASLNSGSAEAGALSWAFTDRKSGAAGSVVWDHIPAGSVSVSCRSEGHNQDAHAFYGIQRNVEEGEMARIELDMTPGTSVLVGVVTQSGQPVASVTVMVYRLGERTGTGGAFYADIRADSNGNYRLEGLRPGEYTIRVSNPQGGVPIADRGPVSVNGETRYDIQIDPDTQ